jgi:hypothetical protein
MLKVLKATSLNSGEEYILAWYTTYTVAFYEEERLLYPPWSLTACEEASYA